MSLFELVTKTLTEAIVKIFSKFLTTISFVKTMKYIVEDNLNKFNWRKRMI